MALSDWDTLAIDEQGRSINGVFVTPLGVQVEFYKNWLYVSDKDAWVPGSFTEPTILHINAGDVRYRDLAIRAVHGPWNGVYAACWSGYTNLKEQPFTGMAGIACYGWDNDDWVGVSENPIKYMHAWLRRRFAAHELPDAMRDANLKQVLRFNQGDAFFARTIGTPLIATLPGIANPTMLSTLMSADVIDFIPKEE